MKPSHKKWTWMTGSCLALGGASLFWWQVMSRTHAPDLAQPPEAVENPDHELKALEMQLLKKPGHMPVLMRMAQIEQDKGKLGDAAEHLREAVKTEPANLDAHLELGRVLYEEGDVPGAISETEKILVSDPKHVDALYNLGAIYANLGNAQRARSYWTRAVDANAQADSGKKAREGLTKLGGS